MRSSRLTPQSLAAVVAIASLGSGLPMASALKPARPATYRRNPGPSMVTAKDREIAAWNAAVDARKAEKKAKRT